MANLKFELQLSAKKDKLIELAMDYENIANYLPNQIKDVKIIEKRNDDIITEEKLLFSTVMKKEILQRSVHKKIDPSRLYTEIISGIFEGSKMVVTYESNDKGTLVKTDIELRLPLRYKLLTILAQRAYKMVLTSVLYKMNTIAMSS